MILQWWKDQGPKRYDQIECLTLTSVTGASFTVTNATPLRYCFDCHPAWCICWPLYCTIAIPYKVWRNGFHGIHDVRVKIEGRLAVSCPESRGYSLENLFQSVIRQPLPGSDWRLFLSNRFKMWREVEENIAHIKFFVLKSEFVISKCVIVSSQP